MGEVWLFFGLMWLMFAGFGAWIAQQRKRTWEEGAALGFLFGPLGCLVEALLPIPTPEEIETRENLKREAAEAAVQTFQAAMEKVTWMQKADDEDPPSRDASLKERIDRERQELLLTEARRAELRKNFNESVEAFLLFWFAFGWFKALPDWLQPILIGLALPVLLAAFVAVCYRFYGPG